MGSWTPQHMEGRERRDQEFKAILNYPMQGHPGYMRHFPKTKPTTNVVQSCCCQMSVSVSWARGELSQVREAWVGQTPGDILRHKQISVFDCRSQTGIMLRTCNLRARRWATQQDNSQEKGSSHSLRRRELLKVDSMKKKEWTLEGAF